MAGHHGEIETTLRAAVAERLGEGRFGLWFGEGVRLGVAGDSLEVGVPNTFFREWIQGHFASNLVEAAEAVTGRPLRLTFRIDDEAERGVDHVIEPDVPGPSRRRGPTVDVPLKPGKGPLPTVDPTPQAPTLPPSDRPRPRGASSTTAPAGRPSRRLDDFVTGHSNRLAHAASVEMVQSLGASFNPLVVHGGVGL